MLDIGTGTGVVPRIRSELGGAADLVVGCDRSPEMLRQARDRVPRLHPLVADAALLPFQQESFNIVTASFVLSHVRDYASALAEILRVLKPNGRIAVSNWASASDPYSAAWSECLAGAISKSKVEQASAEVTPWEEHFSRRDILEGALAGAGFSQVASVAMDVESDSTVEQFLESRELSSAGRLGLRLLGRADWARFQAVVSKTLHNRFGSSFRYRRGALIGIAKKS